MYQFQSDSEIDRFENGLYMKTQLKERIIAAAEAPTVTLDGFEALLESFGYKYTESIDLDPSTRNLHVAVYAQREDSNGRVICERRIGWKKDLFDQSFEGIRNLLVIRELMLDQ